VVSTTEAKRESGFGASPERAAELQAWARSQLLGRSDIDLVLAGHTHLPLVDQVAPNRYYVNTGDWLSHFTYLVLQPGAAPDLRTWSAG
jgi:UDP-2,3-diacylglucosamine hydrolase